MEEESKETMGLRGVSSLLILGRAYTYVVEGCILLSNRCGCTGTQMCALGQEEDIHILLKCGSGVFGYRFVGSEIGPVLSCGALTVGSPPSLVWCDLVCGSLRQVVSNLNEKVKDRRGVLLLGSPQWATSHDLIATGDVAHSPTTKFILTIMNSARDHPTTHTRHSTT